MELSNNRKNPITNVISYRDVVDVRTVAELPELPGVYGFRLSDKPQMSPTLPVVSGSVVYDIVNFNPTSAGKVYVDANNGLCIFNVFNNGDNVTVTYKGAGSLVNTDLFEQVSGDIVNYIDQVSGDIVNYTDQVSGDLVTFVGGVSGDIRSEVSAEINVVSGDISGMMPRFYRHNQGIPATEWIVTHNLGTKNIVWSVSRPYSNSSVDSSNQLTLYYSSGVTGFVNVIGLP